MARTALSSLQSVIATAIAADPWFAGVVIIQDAGTDSDKQRREQALADAGLCVSVFPVEDAQRVASVRGTGLVSASFFVWVEENPTRNAQAQNRNSLETAARIVAIVTAYESGPGELPPQSDVGVLTLLVSSDGVRVYELPFTQITQLS